MELVGDRPSRIQFTFVSKRDGASDVTDYPLGFGWLDYTGIYEHTISCGRITVSRKIAGDGKNACASRGAKIRLGI